MRPTWRSPARLFQGAGEAFARKPRDSVRFVGARHPLLDTATVVPVDLDLGELRALVVSGPNTGGKTVALKTIGLFALLHQAGFRLPAEGAELPVFDQVLADIGDEQSIEMSLSTFSAHLRNIVEILGSAGPRSLVLLDELAAGTDPVEGSALAQALVARLAAQARLTVVTTHYPELKEWASATDGAANASTGFDAETNAPLYEITLGRPGTSQALRIAERLGLERSVVADARNRVSPDQVRLAELLSEAEANVAAGAAALEAARQREAEAGLLAEKAERRQVELEDEIASVRASAAEERRTTVAKAERELEHARGELHAFREELRLARQLEATRAASLQVDAAERERDRRLGAASEHALEADRALQSLDELHSLQLEFSPGDPVIALDVGVRGTITTIEAGKAEVIGGGGVRLRVPLDRLGPDLRPQAARADEPGVRVIASALADVSDQLDVRGTTAQEAREAVRSLLDQAALAGLGSVHVVHGRGAVCCGRLFATMARVTSWSNGTRRTRPTVPPSFTWRRPPARRANHQRPQGKGRAPGNDEPETGPPDRLAASGFGAVSRRLAISLGAPSIEGARRKFWRHGRLTYVAPSPFSHPERDSTCAND